jgi:hypothetical protein
MRLDELLELMTTTGHLNSVQEIILRQAWEGKTYSSMAEEYHFDPDYLKKVAHKLWHLISALLGTPISKTSFRSVVESLEITDPQKQLITSHNHHLLVKTPLISTFLNFPVASFPSIHPSILSASP